jgi:CRP-like cAMP-binding protein
MSNISRRNLAHGFYMSFPNHRQYWDSLEPLFKPVQISKGETLLNQGDLWNSTYYIESGIARLFYSDRNGNEFNKDFFYEGNFFWPVAPSAHKAPSLFAISALSPMTVWKAPYHQFRENLESRDAWHSIALQLAETLAERKIVREASFLLDTPAERYIKLFEEYSELVSRIPDYHIASFLGITQVSFSRIKKKLLGEDNDVNIS